MWHASGTPLRLLYPADLSASALGAASADGPRTQTMELPTAPPSSGSFWGLITETEGADTLDGALPLLLAALLSMIVGVMVGVPLKRSGPAAAAAVAAGLNLAPTDFNISMRDLNKLRPYIEAGGIHGELIIDGGGRVITPEEAESLSGDVPLFGTSINKPIYMPGPGGDYRLYRVGPSMRFGPDRHQGIGVNSVTDGSVTFTPAEPDQEPDTGDNGQTLGVYPSVVPIDTLLGLISDGDVRSGAYHKRRTNLRAKPAQPNRVMEYEMQVDKPSTWLIEGIAGDPDYAKSFWPRERRR